MEDRVARVRRASRRDVIRRAMEGRRKCYDAVRKEGRVRGEEGECDRVGVTRSGRGGGRTMSGC